MRNKLLGITLGLVITTAVLITQTHHHSVSPSCLLPENKGEISAIALQYTLDSSIYTNACYKAFLKRIGQDTKIVGICGSAADADAFKKAVHSWKISNPKRITTVVMGQPITGWCKDRFLVADSNPNTLIHPPLDESGPSMRMHDGKVADELAKALPQYFKSMQIPLKFDAGDVMPSEIGTIVSDTLWRKNQNPHDFQRVIAQAFSGNVIWLRGAPDHHIGMFAAPLQGKMIAVGDTGLGRKLWSASATKELGKANFSRSTTLPFSKAARQLKLAGFNIIPLPTIVLGPKTYISYTNGVFETRGGKRIVYMPWYGVDAPDKAAKRIYEKAGWEVIPIPVRSVYKFRGTIGCLINVLERK